MSKEKLYTLRNPWFAWSVGGVIIAALFSILIGFVWLPSVHKDVSADGLWAMICRAAGVSTSWYQGPAVGDSRPSTDVVLTPTFCSAPTPYRLVAAQRLRCNARCVTARVA